MLEEEHAFEVKALKEELDDYLRTLENTQTTLHRLQDDKGIPEELPCEHCGGVPGGEGPTSLMSPLSENEENIGGRGDAVDPQIRAAEVAADASVSQAAFREALRYDTPTQMLGRRVEKAKVVGGHELQPGQGVLFLWAAANRDEREFPNADRFDIHRRARRILTFGSGSHSCLGAHVAQMEGRVMLEELLALAPEYEVDLSRSRRIQTEVFQGFASLPIRWA